MKLKSLVVVGFSFLLLPQVASAAEVLSVKGTSANFREKPTEGAKIKFSADRFYPVEVVQKKAGWVKVKDFEGDEAWVAERLLTKQPSVVISADKANIREEANTSSDVLFKVERGEVFKIVERKDHWLKVVDARGDGGWVRDDMTWGEVEDAAKPVLKDKLEKLDEKSNESTSASKAKGNKEPKGETEKTNVSVGNDDAKLELKVPDVAEPENLTALCRAYLDDAPEVKVSTPKAEKPADKKKEKAEKKPAAKPAPKADKPKADKKKK
ncbi:MAG: SH3 domain-containing protein [Polyangiaceae bacterium]|nr:SH3 domain-containing protein [Polyangiaceae bacterium]